MGEKFRPRKISEVIGQDNVKNLVRRSLRNKSFPQFSLMYGVSGTGKSTMAEICGLSLTCENPDNGEPCGECKSCKDNLKLLDDGKSSYNLVKLNMGAIERTDFKATMRDVFTLKPAIGDNAVYVFEEIQALTKDEQNILLEYISNVPKNIYVIACTTEMQRLRVELKNRAIKFPFKQIKTQESLKLLERVCAQKGITKPNASIAEFLVRSANNCPREIVNLIDFLADADSLNEADLESFLGYVNNSTYIEYFNHCKDETFDFVQWLDSVIDTGYMNIMRGLRNFVVDCYGYIYGSNTTYFNTHEKHQIKEIFATYEEEKFLSLMKFFDECRYDDDTSAKYCLISGRRFFNNKPVSTVIRESKHEASRAVIKSEAKTKNISKENVKVSKISEGQLDDLLGGLKRVKINYNEAVQESTEEFSEEVDTDITDIEELTLEDLTMEIEDIGTDSNDTFEPLSLDVEPMEIKDAN